MVTRWERIAASLALAAILGGCSSTGSSRREGALCAAPGGPVTGAADLRCDPASVQATSAASCEGMPMDMDGGMNMDMDAGAEEEPPPRFNAAADDDDCKYHVAWTATAVCAGADVTFTVTITRKADGQPATGAAPNLEALLTSTHPAPNSAATTTEASPGVYEIGPVRFDAAGTWIVKFHLYEECADTLPDSPHGHVAFYVAVGASAADGGAGGDAGSCPNDLPTSCPATPPSYASTIQPLVQTRCVSCHSPGAVEANHDFTSYDGLFADRATILSQVYSCSMPLGTPQLSKDERASLLQWLVCGAPNQ